MYSVGILTSHVSYPCLILFYKIHAYKEYFVTEKSFHVDILQMSSIVNNDHYNCL